jgi:preprotein translocase subunit SecG
VFYTIIFAGVAILVVVAVLVTYQRSKSDRGSSEHRSGGNSPSRTDHGSAERKERKRRRTQSRNDRRKRH